MLNKPWSQGLLFLGGILVAGWVVDPRHLLLFFPMLPFPSLGSERRFSRHQKSHEWLWYKTWPGIRRVVTFRKRFGRCLESPRMMLQLLQKHLACFDVSSPLQYHLKKLHWNTYLDQIFQMNFSQTMEINLTIHHPYLITLASINTIVISIIIIITIAFFSRSSTVEQLRHPKTYATWQFLQTPNFTPFLFTPLTPKPMQFETTRVLVKFTDHWSLLLFLVEIVEQLRHPRTLCNMTMPSDTKIFTPFLFTPFTPKPSVQFETTGVFSWNFLLKLRGLFISWVWNATKKGPTATPNPAENHGASGGSHPWRFKSTNFTVEQKLKRCKTVHWNSTPNKNIYNLETWSDWIVKLFGSWVIEYPKFQQVNCFVFGICSLRKASGMNVPPQLIRAD